MTPTSTLQLACPTCGGEIEIEYEIHPTLGSPLPISLRTWCFEAISWEQAYDLLMDEGARQQDIDAVQAERDSALLGMNIPEPTERAGEQP